MNGSFNVHIPIQKSTTTDQLVGLASTTSIDRDGERMSQNALEDMKAEILRVGVNLFGNHEHSWENTLGAIKTATLEGDQLKVGITLDDPSTNPKVPSLLNKLARGINLGLSVGGKVTKSYKEYDKKTGKNVNVIDGVKLYEVSVVGIPSNADAFVALPSAIAKSMKTGKEKTHKLTPEQDKAWVQAFEDAIEDGKTDEEADEIAYEEVCSRWPEIRGHKLKSAKESCPVCFFDMKKGQCQVCFYKEMDSCEECGRKEDFHPDDGYAGTTGSIYAVRLCSRCKKKAQEEEDREEE